MNESHVSTVENQKPEILPENTGGVKEQVSRK